MTCLTWSLKILNWAIPWSKCTTTGATVSRVRRCRSCWKNEEFRQCRHDKTIREKTKVDNWRDNWLRRANATLAAAEGSAWEQNQKIRECNSWRYVQTDSIDITRHQRKTPSIKRPQTFGAYRMSWMMPTSVPKMRSAQWISYADLSDLLSDKNKKR